MKIETLLKDQKAKKLAMEAAQEATKKALIEGASKEELLRVADEAIKKVLAEYKPVNSMEQGM